MRGNKLMLMTSLSLAVIGALPASSSDEAIDTPIGSAAISTGNAVVISGTQTQTSSDGPRDSAPRPDSPSFPAFPVHEFDFDSCLDDWNSSRGCFRTVIDEEPSSPGTDSPAAPAITIDDLAQFAPDPVANEGGARQRRAWPGCRRTSSQRHPCTRALARFSAHRSACASRPSAMSSCTATARPPPRAQADRRGRRSVNHRSPPTSHQPCVQTGHVPGARHGPLRRRSRPRRRLVPGGRRPHDPRPRAGDTRLRGAHRARGVHLRAATVGTRLLRRRTRTSCSSS